MNEDFQVAFSDMAYSRLQGEAQPLLPYLLGFEVVDKNDSNTQAVGIFIFQIYDLHLYVPVFFINGEVKPVILLYLPKQDLFVPLTPEYIRHILKRATMKFGEGVSKEESEVFARPSLERLILPPRTGKYASIKGTPSDIFVRMLYSGWQLEPNVLHKAGQAYPLPIVRTFAEDTDLIKVADKLGIMDSILALVSNAPIIYKEATKIEDSKVRVVEEGDDDFITEVRKSKVNKKKAIRKRFVVTDDGDNTVQLYDTQYTEKIQNPNSNGVYLLIAADGSLVPVIVIMSPKDCNTMHGSTHTLVYSWEDDQYAIRPAERIWVTSSYKVDNLDKVMKQGVEVDKVKVGKMYFLMCPSAMMFTSGHASEPFLVKNKVTTTDGTVYLSVKPCYYNDDWISKPSEGLNREQSDGMTGFLGEDRRGQSSETYSEDDEYKGGPRLLAKIYMTDSDSRDLTQIGTGLAVPKHYRFFELTGECGSCGSLQIGDPGTLNTAIRFKRGYKMLKVRSDGAEYFTSLDEAPWKKFNKEAALAQHLVGLGLNTQSIERILEDVGACLQHKYMVKSSQYNQMDPTLMTDPTYSAAFTQIPEERIFPATTEPPLNPPRPMGEGENLYLGPRGVPGVLGQAPANPVGAMKGLEALGDDQLFEHGMLAAIASTSDTLGMVSSFIPTLNAAVDKLARIIFLFWYKAEDFQDLFQITEYNTQEDMLVQTFKNLGTLVLSFQKKAAPDNVELELHGS